MAKTAAFRAAKPAGVKKLLKDTVKMLLALPLTEGSLTRYGIIAASGTLRLKPEGVFFKNDISVANWFLKGKEDVRSSYINGGTLLYSSTFMGWSFIMQRPVLIQGARPL